MILKIYVIGGWQKCTKFELMNDIHISITSNILQIIFIFYHYII